MSANEIVAELEKLNFPNTFNPYRDRCPVHDEPGASELRRRYLVEMLDSAASSELDSIWVGRDLGHKGGRRTGLALTDDVNFASHLGRWNLEAERPTTGRPVAEMTATAVWSVLRQVKVSVFLWNVFPLHPFNSDKPFSNRPHNAHERDAGLRVMAGIVSFIQPHRFVGVGNDAFSVLTAAFPGGPTHKIRHPSHGGQRGFKAGMNALYAGLMEEPEPTLFD